MPPLRKRAVDIPLLVEEFSEELGAGEVSDNIPYSSIIEWQGELWPGNVRELKNRVEKSLIFGTWESDPPGTATGELLNDSMWKSPGDGEAIPYKTAKARLLSSFEKAYWTDVLDSCRGNVSAAAQRGGIHRKSLEYLMKKHEIKRK